MSATPIATIPTTWDDSRDGAFFRITAGLFSGDFCLGAGVLLANYDVDDTTTHTDSRRRPVCTAPPGELRSGRSGDERERPCSRSRRRCLRMGSSPWVDVERRLSEAVHRVDSTCSGGRTSRLAGAGAAPLICRGMSPYHESLHGTGHFRCSDGHVQ